MCSSDLSALGFGYSDITDNQSAGGSAIPGGGDTSTPFGGIAIVANAANSTTQGVWQYSTDSGSTWTSIGDGSAGLGAAPTTATAILLPTTAKLRFLPNVLDFNGTPGSLSIKVSDATVVFSSSTDISAANATTGQWSATTTLSTSVTAVNDAPLISGLDATSPNATFAVPYIQGGKIGRAHV